MVSLCFAAAVCALTVTGIFEPVDRRARALLWALRPDPSGGDVVVVVEFDDDTARALGARARSIDALGELMERVAATATLAIIEVDAGWWIAEEGASITCPANVKLIGTARPEWLAAACDWSDAPSLQRPTEELDELTRGFGLASSVAELGGKVESDERRLVDLEQPVPKLSAAALYEAPQLPILLRDHAVLIAHSASEPVALQQTSAGERSPAVMKGLVLQSHSARSWFVSGGLLAALFAALFGFVSGAFTHTRSGWRGSMLPPLALGGVIASGVFTLANIELSLTAMLLAFAAARGSLAYLPKRRSAREIASEEELNRIIRQLHKNQTDAEGLQTASWQDLLARIQHTTHTTHITLLAGDTTGLRVIATSLTTDAPTFHDPETGPLALAIRTRTPEPARGFFKESDGVALPLVSSGELVGVLVISTSENADAYIDANRQGLERLQRAAAREFSRRHQTEQLSRALSSPSLEHEALLGATQLLLGRLDLEQATHARVTEQGQVGLALVTMLGGTLYQNTFFRALLIERGLANLEQMSLGDIFQALFALDSADADEHIQQLWRGQSFTIREQTRGERARIFAFECIPTGDASAELYDSVLIMATDITDFATTDQRKLGLFRVMNTRVEDLLQQLEGYTSILTASSTISPGERRIVSMLDGSVEELDELMRDILDTLDPPEDVAALPTDINQLLDSVARQNAELFEPIELDIPALQRPLIGHGHPELLQQAIILAARDALYFNNDHNAITCVTGQAHDGVFIEWRLARVSHPIELIRRVSQMTPDTQTMRPGQHIARARVLLESFGAQLSIDAFEDRGVALRLLVGR